MRYVISAVILVSAIIAGLVYLPERWGGTDAPIGAENTSNDAAFVDMPPPAAPDYSTVVTDEAQAQELAAEADGYIQELSKDGGAEKPLLLTNDSVMAWSGTGQSVAQVLQRYGISPKADALYYTHPVTRADSQGVWGIVQASLIGRFAEGVAVRRGDSQKTYQLLIPQHADERNADGSSSFLGKVIWHKTQAAKVVDTHAGLMRASVEVVEPDQDLVIVSFSRAELVAIYQYFALEGGR
jgi:hypothetical protein